MPFHEYCVWICKHYRIADVNISIEQVLTVSLNLGPSHPKEHQARSA